jgi:hypothetical protein
VGGPLNLDLGYRVEKPGFSLKMLFQLPRHVSAAKATPLLSAEFHLNYLRICLARFQFQNVALMRKDVLRYKKEKSIFWINESCSSRHGAGERAKSPHRKRQRRLRETHMHELGYAHDRANCH